jgi:hypothetical protein
MNGDMGAVRSHWRALIPVWCKPIWFVAAIVLLTSESAYGGAWNQEQNKGLVVFTFSFLQTQTEFGFAGGRRPFGYGGQFRQISSSLYFEYGLSRRYTVVSNINAPVLKFSNQYGSSDSAGPGDIEVGIRRRLNSLESRWPLAAQVTTQFPAYPAARNPAPGNHQEDVEGRLLLGRGGRWGGHPAFLDVEGAFRYRSGPPADQVRADCTGGLDLSHRWMVMAQVFAIKGLRNGDAFNTSNPNAQSDFDLYKGQLSLVARAGHGVRVQVGWNYAIAGRNTGTGQTPLISLWKTF